MKEILQLVLHKLRHPSHYICFDRRCCGRCGYLEKREYLFTTELTRLRPGSESEEEGRKIA